MVAIASRTTAPVESKSWNFTGTVLPKLVLRHGEAEHVASLPTGCAKPTKVRQQIRKSRVLETMVKSWWLAPLLTFRTGSGVPSSGRLKSSQLVSSVLGSAEENAENG